jgi:hypothetical protein
MPVTGAIATRATADDGRKKPVMPEFFRVRDGSQLWNGHGPV